MPERVREAAEVARATVDLAEASGSGPVGVHAVVDVLSCAGVDRLPAASTASTANEYDVPHERPV